MPVSGNGNSWATAFKTVQEAFKNPGFLCGNKEIWVAKGTYYTTTGTDRNISFDLPDGVKLYGGFAGGETSTAGRNFVTNETILSGEIGAAGAADNSYNVMRAQFLTTASRVDGFTIRDGNANVGNTVPICAGGGLFIRSGNDNLTVENIVFKNNNAVFGGALNMTTFNTGITNSISHRIINCRFENNTTVANGAGGAAFIQSTAGGIVNASFTGSDFINNGNAGGGGAINTSFNGVNDLLTVTRCKFLGNIATNPGATIGTGGAVQNSSGGTTRIINSIFANNQANGSNDDGGGAIMVYAGTVSIFNSTFNNNTTTSSYNSGGNTLSVQAGTTVNVNNSIIWGNAAQQVRNGGTINYTNSLVKGAGLSAPNLTVDPQFVNAAANDLHLLGCSPAINAGSNAAIPAGITTDLDNNPRIFNSIVDMGAYEYQANSTGLVAGFTISPAAVQCLATNNFTFTNTSTIATGNITGYNWSFGDATTSTATSPSHVYATAGTFTVKLVVTSDNGCKDSVSQDITVVNPTPDAIATPASQTICSAVLPLQPLL